MSYEIVYTKSFKRSLKKLARSGSIELSTIQKVIDFLTSDGNLPAKFRDHALRGNYAGCRECHIMADLLLIYEIDDDLKLMTLAEIGSHSELFG
ncbi:MAG: type II toxin-antitoxin system YafQ family toxin [Candidatus Paceibacterota bacterium]|jgi:mRNA interferase YafQ